MQDSSTNEQTMKNMEKLFQKLLETLEDVHYEVRRIRKVNERLERVLHSTLAPFDTSYNGQNDSHKVVMVRTTKQ